MLIDFLIGAFAANALPHYVLGRLDARVLSLFGYSKRGNVAYSLLCCGLSLGLFHYKYGIGTLIGNPMLLGVLFVLVLYYVGWIVIERFLTERPIL